MVPGSDWVESLRKAHQQYASAPVIGGPVRFDPGEGASAFQWGDFFYEYGRHMTPADDGAVDDATADCGVVDSSEVDELTGANCSYKRAALE